MYTQTIIEAIRNQKMLSIHFQKETTNEFVTRKVAPYDVYSGINKKSKMEDDVLLGYAIGDIYKNDHPVTIYLSSIQTLNVLNEAFDGQRIRRLLNIKDPPNISRNW